MCAVPMYGLHFGAWSYVQEKYGAGSGVLFAPSLTPCFHGGHVRRARPGGVVSMYMTSLTASQKSKLCIAEALSVGT